MRVAGQGVEKQVGGPVTPEMFGQWHQRRKDQPGRIDAALFGLEAQIADDQLVALEQPQHAAGNRNEQAHPYLEKCWRDLVAVVEAAKHEPLGWQSPLLP